MALGVSKVLKGLWEVVSRETIWDFTKLCKLRGVFSEGGAVLLEYFCEGPK